MSLTDVNPLLIISVVLTFGVMLVNGFTDAPNAIATCVATRCMSPDAAIAMAAVFNFLGVFVMTMFNSAVAETILKLVDFGADPRAAMVALCAALFAIVVWALFAWAFGIPTSESHALIAGLSGGAVALHGSMAGVNGAEWAKVIYGIVISVLFGFSLGLAVCKCVAALFYRSNRLHTASFFRSAQIAGAAAMAFMHGAQDGQKFMGVMLLCTYLAKGESLPENFYIPLWLMVACAVVMAAGTAMGGKKIIKSVGMDMVKLEKYQGFSADLAAAVSLFVCSACSLPVSTTHVKATAIMGAGYAKRASAVDFAVVKDMVLTWVFTFPGCGLVGFGMTKLFMLFWD